MNRWPNRRPVIFGAILAIIVVTIATLGTRAYYNDSEQSTGNTIRVINNWYDLAWHYRKAITISNGGGALTDYQLKLTIDTQTPINAGKMQADGDDIRFTSSDGYTEIINYWIDSGLSTNSTTIWVKIPSIPAGSSTIYIYYGNSSVTGLSSGGNTFIFFDNFETDLSKWTISGSGSATRDSTQQSNGSYSMHLQDTITAYATFTSQTTAVVEYDARPAQTGKTWDMRLRNSGGVRGPSLSFNSSDIQYEVANVFYSTNVSYSANTWYAFSLDEVRVDNDTYDINIDGTLRVNNAGFNIALGDIDRIAFISNDTITTLFVDRVKVRQYASTVPTYSIGSEE